MIFNGSRGALEAIRAGAPSVEVVAVTAPAEILADRLAARGRESADDIRARLDRARWPIPDGARVVVNDGTIAEGTRRLLEAFDAGPGGRAACAKDSIDGTGT